jgi:excisionase family DNA binding protein
VTAKREFYTTNEIAQILGLSPFTVRRYIQTRKLRAVKLEGSYRVRRSHLNQFLADREIETDEDLAAAMKPVEEKSVKPRPPVRPIEKKRAPQPPARPLKRKSQTRPPTRRKKEK